MMTAKISPDMNKHPLEDTVSPFLGSTEMERAPQTPSTGLSRLNNWL